MATKKKRAANASIESSLFNYLQRLEEKCEKLPGYTFTMADALADRLMECARNLYFIAAEAMENDSLKKKNESSPSL